MFVITFFRDVLDGFIYFIYLAVCILAIFYVLGIVGDRKRFAIAEKLKAKKKYDIESGKEAAIAALESKQVLDVMEEEKPLGDAVATSNAAVLNNAQANPTINQAEDVTKKEEVPAVMILNSSDINSASSQSNDVATPNVSVTPTVSPTVINSDSVQINS